MCTPYVGSYAVTLGVGNFVYIFIYKEKKGMGTSMQPAYDSRLGDLGRRRLECGINHLLFNSSAVGAGGGRRLDHMCNNRCGSLS